MNPDVVIENIEEMRRQRGIEDVELHRGIRGLEVGDFINLTLLAPAIPSVGETLCVRITHINGDRFRGRLGSSPVSPGLSSLQAGSHVSFTTAHIHSLARRRFYR
jgi:hypothetical protein